MEMESSLASPPGIEEPSEAATLRELTPMQWKSGLAAWLGWLFDGLDGYLYILVATPFVAQLLHTTDLKSENVSHHAAYIQAAFLVGWALGGAAFGRIGDRIGRSRTISLTILTYALFTGLSAFAVNWQMLLVFRFLAALGIGGEWAAGSSLIAETWPRRWRPWVSAGLQSAYQIGIILATLTTFLMAAQKPQWVFLVGAAPALLTFWIRRAIPEPDEWHRAKKVQTEQPRVADLFRGPVLRTTLLTVLVCSAALTTVWAFLFWSPQQLRHLPDVMSMTKEGREHYISLFTALTMVVAIGGNFFAAFMARRFGYRAATSLMFLGGLITLHLAYSVPRDHIGIVPWACAAHFFVQGVFGLFPLYVPPLFPVLLRTTGAGFCYNVGRLVAAFGTVLFILVAPVKDHGSALVLVGYLYIPAILVALIMPEPQKIAPPAPISAS
jgi:MFS family permease